MNSFTHQRGGLVWRYFALLSTGSGTWWGWWTFLDIGGDLVGSTSMVCTGAPTVILRRTRFISTSHISVHPQHTYRAKERKMTNKCIIIEELPLSSGISIPLFGFGTAAYPFRPDNIKDAVVKAIDLGYRHFDTAALYQAEKPLGEAIREALKLGLIKSREELFVTSKLWCSDAHPHLVLPALQNTLSSKPGNFELYMDKEDMMPFDIGGVWKAMEECQKLGLAKCIGVSNFSCKKLQAILDVGTIPPAVNQVEMNPFWKQKKLRDFCKEKGIHISAYSPLGANGSPWGTSQVMECDVLHNIAQAKGKSIAQICLRWAYEQGVSVLVKSFNEERMKQNLDIFDWNLCEEDYCQIEEIPQVKGFPYSHITGEGTPYKTLDDLWDGEI